MTEAEIIVAGKNIFFGDNVIIGSNSVVNRDMPSNCVVAGSLIHLIREIEDDTPEDARQS